MTKEQKLNKQVEEQQGEIRDLGSKVDQLSDRVLSLQGEVNSFKQAVGGDISKLVERINILKKAVVENTTKQ